MMRRHPASRTIAALAALAAACTGGTETGNPPVVEAQLGLTARASDPAVADLVPGRGGASIDEAWVVLGDVRFELSSACDESDDTRIDLPGLTIVDVAGSTVVRELDLPGDDYCRLRVPLDRATDDLPATAPADLEDQSILVLGARSDGTPLRLAADVRREVDVRSRGEPFSIRSADALLLAFDVSTWFAGVDLDAAEVTGGEIVIDSSENVELLDVFEENVERALALYRDPDRDGELDPDEDDAAPLAEGGR